MGGQGTESNLETEKKKKGTKKSEQVVVVIQSPGASCQT